MNLTPYLPFNLTLRLATTDDRAFLLRLFASSRPVFSQMGLPEALATHLAEQQFQLQQTSYRQQAPNAEVFIVLLHNTPAGQLTVNHSNQDIRLMDLSIVQQHQGQGYGTALIKALQTLAHTQQLPLKLSVDHANKRALALYLKLGFDITQQQDFYYSMSWQCSHPQSR
ncbi:GNAT family N-acetyltransferase [Rheinheimera sp. EpRS3]|uniref:GNAT family N-acetyltransferase n=1 Tax=Rheinheimera sp. EpRS3 TaxID=1712383 RepID=UPI00074782A2|nr:GNAT family N-acetyltransferase [Rheinheimera sp. EpRS3]KUM53926.1 hypothetical protein AR688_06695 [Rheinheimera sp. EpRS3]